MYFMRMHPEAKHTKVGDVKQYFKKLDFEVLENSFNKRFPNIGKDYYGNAFKSNVLWSLELNGLKFNKTNMEKMLGKSFNVNNILGWSDQHSNAGNVENYLGNENRQFFKAMSKYVSAAALRQIVISMFPEHATAVIFDCTRK